MRGLGRAAVDDCAPDVVYHHHDVHSLRRSSQCGKRIFKPALTIINLYPSMMTTDEMQKQNWLLRYHSPCYILIASTLFEQLILKLNI